MDTRDRDAVDRRRFAQLGLFGAFGAAGAGTALEPPGGSEVHGDPTLEGVFDVREYGASGDGSTDDSAALQAALDAAVESHGMCWVPPGQYVVSETLTVRGNTRIQGASNFRDGARRTKTGGSVLQLAEDANVDLLQVTNEGDDSFGFPVVADLTLFGNRANNRAGSGLTLTGKSLSPVVERCNISHFPEHGVHVPSTCNNGYVRGSIIYFNGLNGLNLAAWADGRVVGNSCGRNGSQGITIGAANNQVVANHCWLNGDRGIRVASEGNQILGNRCNHSGGAGIHVAGAKHTVVVGNVSGSNGRDAGKTDDARSGIRVSGATERCQLIGNVVTGGSEGDGTQRRGISAQAEQIVSLSLYGNETSGNHSIEIAVDSTNVRFQFGARAPVSPMDLAADGTDRNEVGPFPEVPAVSGTRDDTTVNRNFSLLAKRLGVIEDALEGLGLLDGLSDGQ